MRISRLARVRLGFNEAAGIHRRKRGAAPARSSVTTEASMRPPEFTGGNAERGAGDAELEPRASMRPPEFTGGNDDRRDAGVSFDPGASMRPPEFTGGNSTVCVKLSWKLTASMRPPEFTGGNDWPRRATLERYRAGFNEAAGIHRRKPAYLPR